MVLPLPDRAGVEQPLQSLDARLRIDRLGIVTCRRLSRLELSQLHSRRASLRRASLRRGESDSLLGAAPPMASLEAAYGDQHRDRDTQASGAWTSLGCLPACRG